jgi:hypothetical protein
MSEKRATIDSSSMSNAMKLLMVSTIKEPSYEFSRIQISTIIAEALIKIAYASADLEVYRKK